MAASAVPLRSLRERALQCLLFEVTGLLLVAPLFALASGQPVADSLALLAALSLVVVLWTAVFNTAFDAAEARIAQRVASDRPPRLRLIHALALEGSAVVVSCPVIVAMTGLDWGSALAADVALTAVYAAYGYAYHWAFDRWRPVR